MFFCTPGSRAGSPAVRGAEDARVRFTFENDYKACDSLGKNDGKKKEISKDVSAFANSAGGLSVLSPDLRSEPEYLVHSIPKVVS